MVLYQFVIVNGSVDRIIMRPLKWMTDLNEWGQFVWLCVWWLVTDFWDACHWVGMCEWIYSNPNGVWAAKIHLNKWYWLGYNKARRIRHVASVEYTSDVVRSMAIFVVDLWIDCPLINLSYICGKRVSVSIESVVNNFVYCDNVEGIPPKVLIQCERSIRSLPCQRTKQLLWGGEASFGVRSYFVTCR